MCDVDMDVTDYGYPTIGARNVMSCIGNTHCIKANVNTYQLARKIEKIIFFLFILSPTVFQFYNRHPRQLLNIGDY